MSTESLLQLIEIALTLVSVPFFMKYKERWRTACIAMLAMPTLLGIVLYFVLRDASMVYCTLICVVAMIYIWPRKREEEEDGE